MKKPLLWAGTLLATAVFCHTSSAASTIWTGAPITFTKAASTDPLLEENQDRITDDIWITRSNSGGLFNAVNETFPGGDSPLGTEWAVGTTADLGSITFGTWSSVFGLSGPFGGPPNAVGEDFVVHLVDDDIYFDLHLVEWGKGRDGLGGLVTYRRSTLAPEPAAACLAAMGFAAVLVRRRKA